MDDLVERRMHAQRLWGPAMGSVGEVVRHFGAVQAQEFLPAKWSIAQRLSAGVLDRDVQAEFDAGTLLRTHCARPTWHFVHPADVRWMLAATSPRVHATNAHMYRREGIDDDVAKRSRAVFESVLGGGEHLTRKELGGALAAAGLPSAGLRLGLVVMRGELDGVLISGAMRGKQHTYALLALRAPGPPATDRDAALAELCRRYFGSRGPATIRDLCSWGSLTVADVRRGLDIMGDEVIEEQIGGRRFISLPAADGRVAPVSPTVDLLQDYDEYVMGYVDSRDVMMGADAPPAALHPQWQGVRVRPMLLDGHLVGFWRHVAASSEVAVEAFPTRPFTPSETMALERSADRFGVFLGRPAAVRCAEPQPR